MTLHMDRSFRLPESEYFAQPQAKSGIAIHHRVAEAPHQARVRDRAHRRRGYWSGHRDGDPVRRPVSVDRLQASVDRLQASFDRLEASPDRSRAVFRPVQAVSRRLHTVSRRLQAVSRRLEAYPRAREALKRSGEACKRCRFGIHPHKEVFHGTFSAK